MLIIVPGAIRCCCECSIIHAAAVNSNVCTHVYVQPRVHGEVSGKLLMCSDFCDSF